MLGAGLLARNAVKRGLKVKPWVKTSLAPGSQVVTDYLAKAGLQKDLDKLGFNLVGYGCTTCIGNSGPLPEPIAAAVTTGDLVVAAVLSGNRNFEGRINPQVRANYLASPPLVVAYALAGSMKVDLMHEPLGTDKKGKPVYLSDIWPSSKEIAEHRPQVRDGRDVPEALRRRLRRRPRLAQDQDRHRPHLPVGRGLHLRAASALFRGHAARGRRDRQRQRRAAARPARRQHHHRPHLARRLDQEGEPGRQLSHRPRRRRRQTSIPTARAAAITR